MTTYSLPADFAADHLRAFATSDQDRLRFDRGHPRTGTVTRTESPLGEHAFRILFAHPTRTWKVQLNPLAAAYARQQADIHRADGSRILPGAERAARLLARAGVTRFGLYRQIVQHLRDTGPPCDDTGTVSHEDWLNYQDNDR